MDSSQKRAYSNPSITEYGDVESLTQEQCEVESGKNGTTTDIGTLCIDEAVGGSGVISTTG